MNWGTKLMIGMALFMSFIVVLVMKMIFSPDDALIEKNYYEKGQTYNTAYNAKQRAVKENVVPEIVVDQYGLTIKFAQPAHYKLVCKRSSDARMDKIFKSETEGTVRIPASKLKKGPWKLQLEFSMSETAYLVEKEIIMP